MKTPDQYFHDWEGETFGYGYGTGEQHTVSALNAFMAAVPMDGNYDYAALERAVGSTVAWLLINTLCREHVFEYGSSPRFGWLTPQGRALKAYLADKTNDAVLSALQMPDGYIECYSDHCNCGEVKCSNPFWRER